MNLDFTQLRSVASNGNKVAKAIVKNIDEYEESKCPIALSKVIFFNRASFLDKNTKPVYSELCTTFFKDNSNLSVLEIILTVSEENGVTKLYENLHRIIKTGNGYFPSTYLREVYSEELVNSSTSPKSDLEYLQALVATILIGYIETQTTCDATLFDYYKKYAVENPGQMFVTTAGVYLSKRGDVSDSMLETLSSYLDSDVKHPVIKAMILESLTLRGVNPGLQLS